jgi:predicted NBD/HSP70 family sugar kinase
MVTALLDLSGGVRAKSILPLEETGPDAVPDRVTAEVRRLEASLGSDRSKLLGIGVVMPGPFEIEGMSSVGPATLPGWTGVDAAALFAKATGQHVVVENDATAAVVGERLYVGVGLGLGVIQEGRPLRGAFGNAGEIGHVGLVPRKGKVHYGPAGALERFVSVFALRERLAMAGIYAATVDDIQKLHDEANPTLLEWIEVAADYLAPTVAMLENVFDPETVIFGGGMPDSVLEAVISALDPLPVSVATRQKRSLPRAIRGQTGQLTAALGAAALPLLDTVSPHLSVSDPVA